MTAAPALDPDEFPEWIKAHQTIDLITRLIAAVTAPGDLAVDPAAGSFTVMHAAHRLGRDFIGCDLAYESEIDLFKQEEDQ